MKGHGQLLLFPADLRVECLTFAEVEALIREPWQISDTLLRRRFPRISPEIPQLDVSVRVERVLQKLAREGIGLEILCNYTVRELLRLKNFGRKSLVELLTAILPYVVDSADAIDASAQLSDRTEQGGVQIQRSLEKLAALSEYSNLLSNDIRFQKFIDPLLSVVRRHGVGECIRGTSSLRDITRSLSCADLPVAVREELAPHLKRLRTQIIRASRMPLESEFQAICESVLKGRNSSIVLRLLGWDGDPPATLQSVGETYGITRERVRQIAAKFLKQFKKKTCFAPGFERARRLVVRSLPSPAEDLECQLARRGIATGPFRLESLLSAAQVLDRRFEIALEEASGRRFAVWSGNQSIVRSIRVCARKLVSHYGVSTVADVVERAISDGECDIDLNFAQSVLEEDDAVQWLDEERNWFSISDVPRNHLTTVVNKVLSVARHIHVSELRASIAKDYRGMGYAPPKGVVTAFCKARCQCTIHGDFINAPESISATSILSESERIVYDVLTERGPLLHRLDFERTCLQKGMNASTFSVYLGHSPILTRYAPSVYGLRGANFSQEDLERCRRGKAPTRLSDHGWKQDGRLWVAITLGSSALATGILSISPALRHMLVGIYTLTDDEGTDFGTITVAEHASWGFSKYFRRRGGEAGDTLILLFNRGTRQVSASLGSAEDVTSLIESQ